MTLTRQEIFDTVATHLLTQGRRSVDRDTECVYRAPNGDRCAAGAVLRDEQYTPEMETWSCDSGMPGRFPNAFDCVSRFAASGICLDDFDMLRDLQGIHDGVDVDEWAQKLAGYAKHNNLTMPELLRQRLSP